MGIRPDLESKRQQLIVEGAENAKALLDVENNILQILSAPGNILEDENAVDVLDNSKVSRIDSNIYIYSIITEIYHLHESNDTMIILRTL